MLLTIRRVAVDNTVAAITRGCSGIERILSAVLGSGHELPSRNVYLTASPVRMSYCKSLHLRHYSFHTNALNALTPFGAIADLLFMDSDRSLRVPYETMNEIITDDVCFLCEVTTMQTLPHASVKLVEHDY